MIFFETIKCDDFEIFNLAYHKKRISDTIGLNISLEEYIYPLSNELLKCKVTYNQNGILDICYNTYTKKDITSFQLVYDDTIKYNKKLVDRTNINKLLELKNQADEIIIVKDNLITDTSIANIAIYLNNQWITPKKPLLKGTMRAWLIDNNHLKLEDITIDMLKSTTKIATLNAMVGFNIINNFTIKGYIC